jgi:hypothetical protein
VSSAAYDLAANWHRPDAPALLAAEIRRLHADGLSARDISTALHLPPDMIITILYGEPLHAHITEHR